MSERFLAVIVCGILLVISLAGRVNCGKAAMRQRGSSRAHGTPQPSDAVPNLSAPAQPQTGMATGRVGRGQLRAGAGVDCRGGGAGASCHGRSSHEVPKGRDGGDPRGAGRDGGDASDGIAIPKGLTRRMGQPPVKVWTKPVLEGNEAGAIDPGFVVTHAALKARAPQTDRKFRAQNDGDITLILRPGF